MARPRKKVDPALVTELARIHCTYEEIAAVCGVSTDTLSRRFADLIEKGRDEGKMSLRRHQWSLAAKGDKTMLIWLGKQHLGQSDRSEFRVGDLSKLTDEELAALVAGKSGK